jgi:hypothetical protein
MVLASMKLVLGISDIDSFFDCELINTLFEITRATMLSDFATTLVTILNCIKANSPGHLSRSTLIQGWPFFILLH